MGDRFGAKLWDYIAVCLNGFRSSNLCSALSEGFSSQFTSEGIGEHFSELRKGKYDPIFAFSKDGRFIIVERELNYFRWVGDLFLTTPTGSHVPDAPRRPRSVPAKREGMPSQPPRRRQRSAFKVKSCSHLFHHHLRQVHCLENCSCPASVTIQRLLLKSAPL